MKNSVSLWDSCFNNQDKGCRNGIISKSPRNADFSATEKMRKCWLSLFDHNQERLKSENILWGNFPSGSVVENPPANAGDTSSILGSGRFHMLQSNYACALQQERPLQWEACALQLDSSLQLPQLEKATCSNEDSTQPKIHTYIYVYMYIYTISHEAPYTGTCLACMRC